VADITASAGFQVYNQVLCFVFLNLRRDAMASISGTQRELAPVTIIVPAYNEAECIAETLRSLTNQTFPPARIIVGPYTGSAVPIDAATGASLPSFPVFNGPVNTVVSDGHGGWYVGANLPWPGRRPVPAQRMSCPTGA
jgi:hypothetical protein